MSSNYTVNHSSLKMRVEIKLPRKLRKEEAGCIDSLETLGGNYLSEAQFLCDISTFYAVSYLRYLLHKDLQPYVMRLIEDVLLGGEEYREWVYSVVNNKN